MTNLPLFKPGQVIPYSTLDEVTNWTFTYLVDGVPHLSSHRFESAVEAKAAMRRLVASYNELYERFK